LTFLRARAWLFQSRVLSVADRNDAVKAERYVDRKYFAYWPLASDL
jgi:hypothetical protein